ncbi:tRNA-dihydrouridine synthase [Histoplasma capsulatum G186AR]|uniref:tRNA-dihydrouridine synthase n=1 Tax=Ajellomyces capsulatus TaxID=5037 RepID=A0A8H8CTA0_AJECA|nr:tRNA-dihydrouridine synthase [Histoplasma capsulatum]QSS73352.1 tRNA-dihydrouridine synthase [Histoplasma capsulatum G186AR]
MLLVQKNCPPQRLGCHPISDIARFLVSSLPPRSNRLLLGGYRDPRGLCSLCASPPSLVRNLRRVECPTWSSRQVPQLAHEITGFKIETPEESKPKPSKSLAKRPSTLEVRFKPARYSPFWGNGEICCIIMVSLFSTFSRPAAAAVSRLLWPIHHHHDYHDCGGIRRCLPISANFDPGDGEVSRQQHFFIGRISGIATEKKV